jgi:hypothetical protein
MKGAAPGPWGWARMSAMIGSVTRDRYHELVKQGRGLGGLDEQRPVAPR